MLSQFIVITVHGSLWIHCVVVVILLQEDKGLSQTFSSVLMHLERECSILKKASQ